MQLTILPAGESFTHVAIVGRLDIAGVNAIADPFTFNTTPQRKSTLVDVSQVTFIASLGIGMLVGAAKALQRHGARMVLIGPRGLVLQTLQSAGIEHVVSFAPTREDALKMLG